MEEDKARIAALGGPAKLAAKLNYGAGGVQRVQNWITRGIPWKVKAQHPNLFLRPLDEVAAAGAQPEPESQHAPTA